MTMVFLQAGAPGPITVKLEVDSFAALAVAKLEQPGNPATPVPPTNTTAATATWQVHPIAGHPAITFSIDWLAVAPQDAGKPFDAKLTVVDAAGVLLAPFAGSANPTVETSVIGPPENPTHAGTFGVAIA